MFYSHSKGRKKNPETLILHEIKKYLESQGYYVHRNQQNIGSMKGTADLTALKRDKPAAYIEVKKPGGKLSEHQEKFRDNILNAGHLFVVAKSIEDVLFLGKGVEATDDEVDT